MKNKQILFVFLGLIALGLASLGVWSVSSNEWRYGRGGYGFFDRDRSYSAYFYENTYRFAFTYPNIFSIDSYCGTDDVNVVREISINSTDPRDTGINEIACIYVRTGKEELGTGEPTYVGNSQAMTYLHSIAGGDFRKYEVALGNNKYLYFRTYDDYLTRSNVNYEDSEYFNHFLELADGVNMVLETLMFDAPVISEMVPYDLNWTNMYTRKFSVMVPPGFVFNELMGIDSYTGEFRNGKFVLTYDIGVYTGELVSGNDPSYFVSYEIIDGQKAKIVTPSVPGAGMVGVYFGDLEGEKFNMYGQNLTAFEQETALKIFRSIKFNR